METSSSRPLTSTRLNRAFSKIFKAYFLPLRCRGELWVGGWVGGGVNAVRVKSPLPPDRSHTT